MKFKISTANLFEARKDKDLMRVLFSLTIRNLGPNRISSMRYEMHTVFGDFAKKYKIILARNSKKIAGWALLAPYDDIYHAQFYVARAFRRKGLGTILYNKGKTLCPKNSMFCLPWDEVSAKFFERNKAQLGEFGWDTTSLDLTEIYSD